MKRVELPGGLDLLLQLRVVPFLEMRVDRLVVLLYRVQPSLLLGQFPLAFSELGLLNLDLSFSGL